MKQRKLPILLLLSVALFTSGCIQDECIRTETYQVFDPVVISPDSIRSDIRVLEPREMCQTGNITYFNGLLLINELREGVHVIDNSDPANPTPLAFIEIPGNLDMAVRGGILYADLYIDLVAIDIKDIMNARIVGRQENAFEAWYPRLGEEGFIVDYIPTTETVEIDCNNRFIGQPWFRMDQTVLVDVNIAANLQSSDMAQIVGINGSMARFTISKAHLYTIDEWRVDVYNIEQVEPAYRNTVDLNWGIETLFAYGDYIFVGATQGMHILDNTDPSNPVYLSQFIHAQSCDPVFVKDDIAYVTLRSGNACAGFVNQLDVIDVSDMANPSLIRSFMMENPHGLSVVDSTLYLCEGNGGLKVFDCSNVNAIAQNLLEHKTDINAFDVIALPGEDLVMVIGSDGLIQYNAADRTDLASLSEIRRNCN